MSELGVKTEWIALKCGMEPCTVMIRIQFGNQGRLALVCKWCQQRRSHWQRQSGRRDV